MKISTKTRYGLRALIYIATQIEENERKLVRIKEISEDQNLSIQYLEQILFKLKKANIIEGKRGPNGGYKLIKKASEINILEIFEILESDVRVVVCDKHSKACVRDNCKTIYLWDKMNKALTDILKNTTLRELIDNDIKEF
ncbi:BadM/Rrf2 family transcriptional regulator [Hypnocyclicus thermotrophus]|uniref:BadM/Rrf2 family transcriptional regulator n=1 Tax=Hypnocyclicus thermotrophus TaxID=1627895 RepID=A0AA46DY67_9FUSO|nr:Rrf2 family transcriptional regulator [Hypnocyclicus thermotrophus]TDT69770.1 BadM/Rrf2 family transcriptional regulator [Hypnocyclicus thermotrophus]